MKQMFLNAKVFTIIRHFNFKIYLLSNILESVKIFIFAKLFDSNWKQRSPAILLTFVLNFFTGFRCALKYISEY